MTAATTTNDPKKHVCDPMVCGLAYDPDCPLWQEDWHEHRRQQQLYWEREERRSRLERAECHPSVRHLLDALRMDAASVADALSRLLAALGPIPPAAARPRSTTLEDAVRGVISSIAAEGRLEYLPQEVGDADLRALLVALEQRPAAVEALRRVLGPKGGR